MLVALHTGMVKVVDDVPNTLPIYLTPKERKTLLQTKELTPDKPINGWNLELWALIKRKSLIKIKVFPRSRIEETRFYKKLPWVPVGVTLEKEKIALKEVHKKLQDRTTLFQYALPRKSRFLADIGKCAY